ncbi:MAG: CopD family protein [Deltaproteobacteria bacterium]|nr:CopD family protein [Deltaproteobacteria bacterium]MBI3295656.1 CopD family protein [Deltaproteobacteria bacterium]
MSLFRTLLALHIMGIISWMAGILYLYRLFVYHALETERVVKDRFQVMEWKLYRYITLPAMVVATGLGLLMIHMSPGLIVEHWMHAKLGLAAILIIVTLRAGRFVRSFREGRETHSHRFFRVMNEIPTLLMILIVLLVILRPSLT